MLKPVSIVVRVLVALLVLALVVGGAFRGGYVRGVAESPAIAAQMQRWQEANPSAAPYFAPQFARPMARGVYPWGMYHGGGFHVVGRVIGLFILAALFFGLMRLLFFGRMMRHYAFGHGHGPDGPMAHGPWGHHMPPWAREGCPPAAEQTPAQPQAPAETSKT